MEKLKDTCAIVGVGKSPVGKLPDISSEALSMMAITRSLEDAGLAISDVDGLIAEKEIGSSAMTWANQIGVAMGMHTVISTDLDTGGATAPASVQYAVMLINSGMCKTVVCFYGDKGVTGARFGGRRVSEFETPYGYSTPAAYHALAWRRYMHEYGGTEDTLGAIAMAFRKNAVLNPDARYYKQPMTIEDYKNSRMIVSPLRLTDICMNSDGAVAVVITSVERGNSLKKKPIKITGMGHSSSYELFRNHEEGWIESGPLNAGDQCFDMAGLKREDVDVAELYDCFTPTVVFELEGYRFCERGEAADFVKDGNIERDGKLPLNTSGGLLSDVYITGWTHITEAVQQLRGEAGPRQIDGAEVAFACGYGGSIPHLCYGALLLTK